MHSKMFSFRRLFNRSKEMLRFSSKTSGTVEMPSTKVTQLSDSEVSDEGARYCLHNVIIEGLQLQRSESMKVLTGNIESDIALLDTGSNEILTLTSSATSSTASLISISLPATSSRQSRRPVLRIETDIVSFVPVPAIACAASAASLQQCKRPILRINTNVIPTFRPLRTPYPRFVPGSAGDDLTPSDVVSDSAGYNSAQGCMRPILRINTNVVTVFRPLRTPYPRFIPESAGTDFTPCSDIVPESAGDDLTPSDSVPESAGAALILLDEESWEGVVGAIVADLAEVEDAEYVLRQLDILSRKMMVPRRRPARVNTEERLEASQPEGSPRSNFPMVPVTILSGSGSSLSSFFRLPSSAGSSTKSSLTKKMVQRVSNGFRRASSSLRSNASWEKIKIKRKCSARKSAA